MKSKFSKALVLLLTLALIATQFMVPVFATETTMCTCEGTPTRTLIDSADQTCTEYGYNIYTCDTCAGQYIEAIDPLGHDEQNHGPQTPTCTDKGWDAYVTCSRCDYSTYVEKPATGHTPAEAVDENVDPAECGEPGKKDIVVYCSVCNVELSREENVVIPALEHKWGEEPIDKSANYPDDCFDHIWEDYECELCGEVQRIENPEVAGHDYVTEITEATCTTPKKIKHTCEKCDYTFTEIIGEPLGHTEVVEVAAVAATCTEPGSTAKIVCSVCGETLVASTPIDALGHDYDTVVVEASCAAAGYTSHTCSVCGDTYTSDPVAALAHTPIISKNPVEANCSQTGLTTEISCSVCKQVLRAQVEVAKNDTHNLVQVEAKAPECEQIGWDTYEYCTRCDYTTYNELAALEHITDGTVGITRPTCTEQGYTTKHCSICNENFKDPDSFVPALGHTIVNHEAKAPTCTEIGWDAYETCEKCDHTTYVEKAALGHDYKEIVTAPTCTEQGYTTKDCTRCDATDAIIPDSYKEALGHGTIVDVEAVAPTYDTTGLTAGKKCTVCGEFTEPQTVIDRLSEEVKFTYEATGINGTANAINSGYVTFNVYMNVETDIARLYAFNLEYTFGSELTLVGVENGEAFAIVDYNAPNATSVKLMPNMGMTFAGKEFAKGKYLVATITFKVDKAFTGTAVITAQSGSFARDEEVLKNAVVVDYGTGAEIEVVILGDANDDAIIDAKDVLEFAKWSTAADEGDYNAIYDLNKDGAVDGADFALLRAAAVGGDGYLN